MKNYGINIEKDEIFNDECFTYEMTGNAPNNMTKSDFSSILSEKISNSKHISLTKETKCLITDSLSSKSSKMNKARKYGIAIKLYTDFL